MRELISLCIRPTLMGWMLLPMLIFWRIMSGILALLPDTNITFAIWDLADSITVSLSEIIYDSIKNDASLWDVI